MVLASAATICGPFFDHFWSNPLGMAAKGPKTNFRSFFDHVLEHPLGPFFDYFLYLCPVDPMAIIILVLCGLSQVSLLQMVPSSTIEGKLE